jgi:hypothetical protein
MEFLKEYFFILAPIIFVEFLLFITALVHVLRHDKYRFGNRILWVLLCFIGFVGPILYFTIGRGEE